MPATNKKMELITKVKMGGCSRWGRAQKMVELKRENKRKENNVRDSAWRHTKKKVRLKRENRRKGERVEVIAGSTQRKG